MADNTLVVNDFVILTQLPSRALAKSLVDFLAANGIYAFSIEDDARRESEIINVQVSASDEALARTFLAKYQNV